MRTEMLLLMIGGVLLSSFSQVLLKKSAEKSYVGKSFLWQYLNPLVIGGYSLLLVSMLIPLYAYQFVDLKYGAVIEALGYGFIMVFSALFIREKITKRKLIGNILVVIGVVVFSSTI